ncbi:MAG: TRAP transporter substrate-binding protein [Opitutales bacterium]
MNEVNNSETNNISKRSFLKKAGATAALVASAPYIMGAAKKPIRWRMQTYAGSVLGEHVIKPAIDAFNKAANGEMIIDLYYADQLIPTSELFSALQKGTIDCVQSDDDSMDSQADVAPFSAYFPMATRYSLDVPALFNQFGLGEVWADSYKAVKGITWISSGGFDPCHFITKKPIKSIEDLKGLKIYTAPTIGRFLNKFGVIPVTVPYEDVEMAIRTGELDGTAWCGITEAYTVGWANPTEYFLTNNISGAWIGSFLANTKSWEALPEHLQELFKVCMDSSHYYRQYWYWGGEADLRVNGDKLKLTTLPPEDYKKLEDASADFWKDIVAEGGPNAQKVVDIFTKYNAMMEKAGPPYRY